ncbi:MAG: hypothetical protein ACRC4M_01235 [Mycoplasma sp.]
MSVFKKKTNIDIKSNIDVDNKFVKVKSDNGFNRNSNVEIHNDNGEVITLLYKIINDINELKNELKNDVKNHSKRLQKLEQSVKKLEREVFKEVI